jgi:hypothetical protein
MRGSGSVNKPCVPHLTLHLTFRNGMPLQTSGCPPVRLPCSPGWHRQHAGWPPRAASGQCGEERTSRKTCPWQTGRAETEDEPVPAGVQVGEIDLPNRPQPVVGADAQAPGPPPNDLQRIRARKVGLLGQGPDSSFWLNLRTL